jgi:hypothetical protein
LRDDLGIAPGRRDDDRQRRVGPVSPDRLEHLHPVEQRETEIEEDQVRPGSRQRLEGLDAVGGLGDRTVESADEQVAQQGADVGVVFDKQHVHGCRSRLGRAVGAAAPARFGRWHGAGPGPAPPGDTRPSWNRPGQGGLEHTALRPASPPAHPARPGFALH